MFTYEQNNKHVFSMGSYFFYLTNEEVVSMQNGGISRDEIITYVFEMLSKKKLSDFSNIQDLFSERIHG